MVLRVFGFLLSLSFVLLVACGDEGGSSRKASTTANDDDAATSLTGEDTGAGDTEVSSIPTPRTSGTSTGTNTSQNNVSKQVDPSSDFDGLYNITFKRQTQSSTSANQGSTFLRAEINIANGLGILSVKSELSGSIVEIKGSFTVDELGFVTTDIRAEVNGENVATVQTNDVRIQSETLQGTYTYKIGEERVNGVINGVLVVNDVSTEVVTDFDGLYQVDFRRELEGEILVRACILVDQGAISQIIGDGFVVAGQVQANGTFDIFPPNTASPDKAVAGSGIISPDGEVAGQYEIVGAAGFLSGGKTEPCNDEIEKDDDDDDDDSDTNPGDDDNPLEDKTHILCEVDISLSGDGIFGFVTDFIATLGSKNELYCTASSSCGLVNETLEVFPTASQCSDECERLAEDDPTYEEGCRGFE